MFPEHMELGELIGSRICHDLISPLGAISNGLEMLSMTGVEESPELELIAQSIANANSKIRFFRVAYGRAPKGTSLAETEIRAILGDYFRASRLAIEWTPEGELPRREVKLAFLAIQCLETALPYGGAISVARRDGVWRMRAEGAKLRLERALWDGFGQEKPAGELTASEVQFGMFAALLKGRAAPAAAEIGETAIDIRF